MGTHLNRRVIHILRPLNRKISTTLEVSITVVILIMGGIETVTEDHLRREGMVIIAIMLDIKGSMASWSLGSKVYGIIRRWETRLTISLYGEHPSAVTILNAIKKDMAS